VKRARLVPDDQLPPAGDLTPPWPARSLVLDGLLAHVRDTPAPPGAQSAVYVHGLGGSSLNWTDLAGLLADRVEGTALDLPGFGRSEPTGRYGVADLADWVARWIEEADRGPVHLFGNSLGGAVAVHVAGTRPDLVRTLTLISPAMPFLDPRRSFHGRMLPLLMIPRADRFAAKRLAAIDPADLARMVIASCFADPSRYPEQRFAEALEEARLRYTVPWYTTAYVQSLRGLVTSFLRAYLPGAGSLWRVASRITAPTLVIGGRQDQLIDVRVAAQVAAVVPDSRLLMLDGVGHVAQMEVPRLVARAARALLDEVAAGSAAVPVRSVAASRVRPGVGRAPARPRRPVRDVAVAGESASS
jgi:pimeloyl-ACP methyl ester carboxylesterase